ncbi:MAG: transcriptional repressor [Cytophagales bacterium]
MDKQQILKEKKLKVTSCRLDVLDYLDKSKKAVGQPELEKKFQGKYDRVTLYRTLHSFLSVDIVHQVPDNVGEVKYALCHHEHNQHHEHHHHAHIHNHLHFKCTNCESTTCIDDVPIQIIQLPFGYELDEIQLLGIGICKNCSQKNK